MAVKQIVLITESNMSSAGETKDPISLDHPPSVYSTDKGCLVCVVEETTWCMHVQDAIQAGLDSEELFGELAKDNGNFYVAVVPIFPAAYHIYADVYFDIVNGTMANVRLWNNHCTNGKHMPSSAELRLGMICLGDGRKQLRQMILAWLELRSIEPPATGCSALSHTWQRKAQLQKDWGAEQMSMVHAWCMIWYGKCYHCLQDEGASKTFDPDLIPR